MMDLITLLRQLLGQQTQQYNPAPFYQAGLENYFKNIGAPVQNEGGITGFGKIGNFPEDMAYPYSGSTIHPFQQQADSLLQLLSQYAPPTDEYKVPFNQRALVPSTFSSDINKVQFPNGNMLNLTSNQGTLR